MKKLVAVVLTVGLLFSLGACTFLKDVQDLGKGDVTEKVFEFDDVSLTLSSDFIRMGFIDESYDFIVGNEVVAVYGLKAPFEDTELAEYTVAEYAELFSDQLEYDATVSMVGEIPTVEYGEDDMKMITAFYKGDTCFWVIMFGVATEEYDASYPDICNYIKSVKCK